MFQGINWIQKLRGSNDNQLNDHLTMAKLYRAKCIKEFAFDPIAPVELHNQSPKIIKNLATVAVLEWLRLTEAKKYRQKELRKKLKVKVNDVKQSK